MRQAWLLAHYKRRSLTAAALGSVWYSTGGRGAPADQNKPVCTLRMREDHSQTRSEMPSLSISPNTATEPSPKYVNFNRHVCGGSQQTDYSILCLTLRKGWACFIQMWYKYMQV